MVWDGDPWHPRHRRRPHGGGPEREENERGFNLEKSSRPRRLAGPTAHVIKLSRTVICDTHSCFYWYRSTSHVPLTQPHSTPHHRGVTPIPVRKPNPLRHWNGRVMQFDSFVKMVHFHVAGLPFNSAPGITSAQTRSNSLSMTPARRSRLSLGRRRPARKFVCSAVGV